MAWSDAAREAALEARRRHAKTGTPKQRHQYAQALVKARKTSTGSSLTDRNTLVRAKAQQTISPHAWASASNNYGWKRQKQDRRK